jgi:putative holliday junction resolvase
MRWLCLDVGTKAIGLALSDELAVVANPLCVLQRSGGEKDLEALESQYGKQNAGAIVLGLPLDLEGREGAHARRVRKLGADLAQRIGCPVRYWDERFSTTTAEAVLVDAGVSRKRRKAVVDKVAAVVILQAFLDAGTPEEIA